MMTCELVKKIQLFNDCQHKIFTEITTAVSCDNETKLFFIKVVLHLKIFKNSNFFY